MSESNLKLKNVIVAIDPMDSNQYGLERAIEMNAVLEGGINIHLFITTEMDKVRKAEDSFEFTCEGEWYGELTKPMADRGIDYTAQLTWTDNWHRSINAAAEKQNADLIIMSDYTSENSQTELTPSQWALLRASKCPVMIVYPNTGLENKTVLAAVNMQTDNPRYAELNEKINTFSNLLADKYDAEKHIVNAYDDGMEYPDRAKLIRDTNTKQENIHVKQGSPRAIISETATEINANIVVIGTLARSGIMAAMRGNKSEKIIRDLKCDVMVLN